MRRVDRCKHFCSQSRHCLTFCVKSLSDSFLCRDDNSDVLSVDSTNSHTLSKNQYNTSKSSHYEALLTYYITLKPFNSQDLINNSPYCLLYSSCDASLENLVLDQLIIP